jgi:ATP-binding cassette subfamily C protein CydC
MRPRARLLGLLVPSWRMALLGIFLSLLALLANMALLALSSWFITSMAVAGALRITMEYTLPGTGVRALALTRAIGRYAERFVNHDTTLRSLSSLRVWFFARIEPLAPARLAQKRSGDLLSRVRADVDTLDDFYVRGVVPAVVAVLAVACITPFLARYDARLIAVDLAGLAAGGVLLPLLLRRLAAAPGAQRVALSAELRASIVEGVQGMAELIALGAVEEHAARVVAANRDLDRRQRRLASLTGVGEAGLVAASALAVWAAAWLLAPRVIAGALAGPELAMLLVFVLASFESIMPLPAVIQRAGEMDAAAGRLFELIDEAPAVGEPAPGARRIVDPAEPGLGLQARNLRFRYAPGERWIIDGLSLDIPCGARIGIVGPTGIGKSSLVNLLLRFWDYEGGSVRLTLPGAPDVELRSLTGGDARRLFAVMPQAPHLFHASLRENLLIAAPEGAPFTDETMRRALADAQLGEFLDALPDGLDTTVGETGRELSTGEARRVALARALLKEAPFVLLDEPTEALDGATADRLLASVNARLAGKTLIVITHRARDLAVVDTVVRMGGAAEA